MQGHRRPGPQPQLPQPMADREGKARIAQVMEQLAAHLGHHVARRAMAAAGLKTQGRLPQPLIGRSEQVVVVGGDRNAQPLLLAWWNRAGQGRRGPRCCGAVVAPRSIAA